MKIEKQFRERERAETLQPDLPRVSAIALPIPLEAPVTTTTGASTFLAAATLDCSTAATWALIPTTKRRKEKDF